MSAPLVNLFVHGMRGPVVELLRRLETELGDATIWRDEDLDPAAHDDAEYAMYDGHVAAELHNSAVNGRAEAIAIVAAAVVVVDPEHEIIVGGDIYKRPV